jgi:hypothetical protein
VRRFLVACALAALSLPAAPRDPSPRAEVSATPSVTAPAAPSAPALGGAAPGEQVDAELRALEERVAALQERVARTRARLQRLEGLVVGGDLAAGARAVVVHRNEMGAAFVLESVTYTLDGAAVFSQTDAAGELDQREELEVFAGRVAPGPHQLAVELGYRARGYAARDVDGQRFQVRATHAFEAAAGSVTAVRAVGFERGGLSAALADRPAVRWEVSARKEAPATAGTAAPRPGEGAAR